MEKQHFGSLLRGTRERRSVSLADVADRTKVAPSMLQLIESGELNGLPADVFVRGFIRSYARTLGISHEEPLGLFDRAVETRRLADEAKFTQPQLPALDDEAAQSRKGRGLAVFVIIVLVIATITWSLFLRQPPQSGESLSIGPAPGSAPAATG